jgi:hypothetical protein
MMKAVQEARAAAEAGDIKTLVVDPLNFWADRLMDQCNVWHKTKEGNEDGRKAHPECTKRLRQLCYQLLGLPCHVIVVTHYLDVGDAAKRGGPDKVPMLPNKEARSVVHGMFPHKLWMQFDDKGERIFVMTPQGFTGPGVRGYRGASTIPASIQGLMRELSLPGAEEEEERPAPKAVAAPAPKPTAPISRPAVPAKTLQNGHSATKPTTPNPARPITRPIQSRSSTSTATARR